jgi:hypothetical protein
VKTIADAGSLSDVIHLFQLLLDVWNAGNLPSLLPNPGPCEKYSAEHQTRALDRTLKGLPALEPLAPGVCTIPPSLQEFIGPEGWVIWLSDSSSLPRQVFTRVVHGGNGEY